jgi:type I restriction enzyme S subunit
VQAGDVLLAWSGTPGTSFGVHIWNRGFGILNQHIFRVDLDQTKITRRWFMHAVNGQLNKLIAQAHGGVGLQHVTRPMVDSLEIPLPPIDEQRRIAAILDKADALRRKRKRALELLDSLTQPVFLEMFGDPVGSAEYKPEAMGGAILAIESGWSPTCLDRAAMVGEAGVLKLSAVTTSEYAWKENKALPTGLRPKANTEVVAGDILFCRKNTRELVGSSVYVWNTRPHLYMSDLIFRLVPETSRINPIFLQAQISLPSQRRKISEMSGGAAGSMPNVSKAKLRDLQIIIPRLETQMEFARIVQSYRASWAHHAQSLKYSDFLFSSLQSRAFSGQL